MVAVTGVSGSGKSSLVTETLAPALLRELHGTDSTPGAMDGITGLEMVDKTIVIDQSPIGRTPRSNPATYTGAFGPIGTILTDKIGEGRGYEPDSSPSMSEEGGARHAAERALLNWR